MDRKSICIIPARGGSKRIPRKNIKHFLGKPIISYSIKAALQSNIFDVVMVSTDDTEIAEVAKNYGAAIPFLRSAKNSDDHATTADVLIEVLNTYQKELDRTFDVICCLYPCAPLVQVDSLKNGYNKLIHTKLSSVIPVVPFSYPIQRALDDDDGILSFSNPEYASTRSQDLRAKYHDAGMFYFAQVDKFLKNKKLISKNCGSIIMDEFHVQDIDNMTDWQLAELKYKLNRDVSVS